MAVTKDNTTEEKIPRSVSKKLNLLDQKMDGLYKDIYISRPDNRKNYSDIIDSLDASIDKLQGAETTAAGMSELLRRIDKSNETNTQKLMSSVQELFDDQSVLGTVFQNETIHKYIAGENYNYDLICKYLPRLEDALDILKDNVLCSDNFAKQFLNPVSGKSSKEEVEKFSVNTKRLEKEYDIEDFLEDTYDKTAKYGEDFVYVVPYSIAFERIFKKTNRRLNSARAGQVTLFEGYTSETCLEKDFLKSRDFLNYVREAESILLEEDAKDLMKDMPAIGSIKLHFNTSGVISNSVNECAVLREKAQLESLKSLSESYQENGNVVTEARSGLTSMFDSVQKANKKLNRTAGASDGLIATNLDLDASKLDKDFLGTVLERLPRENILPVYIGKKCLGYYYFEFAEDPGACGFCGAHHSIPGVSNGNKFSFEASEQQQELAIRYIASRISRSIDTKFINANKDLKEEIYALLSYNNKFDISRSNDIGVTFIPAEDIIHTYFKLDPNTHRGISLLHRSLMPAMMYILLYLTDIIGKITRSNDKRIYYVKQNVETNVARTMMNVVQQIKKGNFGMRQIESMNNILNIVGKYNDFIIPMGPSGDSPIQFEVMNGQEVNTPTDLMEKMEESAVNPILPYEMVNATYQQDFATRFTMSNTRLLKRVYTLQRRTEDFFSKIYTPTYNYEFGTNFSEIKIILPPPSYLTINNNSQLVDNVTQMADKIIELELATEEEDVKTEFKKLYVRENLSTYIDFDAVERLKSTATINVETNKPPTTNDGSSVEDMMDDDI